MEIKNREIESLRSQAETLTKRLAELQRQEQAVAEPEEPSKTGLFISGSKARIKNRAGMFANAITGLGSRLKHFTHDTVVLGAHERAEATRREREALLARIKELECK